MTKQRASLGFDAPAEPQASQSPVFDPAEWQIGAPARPRPDAEGARKAAEATGFQSRQAPPHPRQTSGQGAGSAVEEAKPVRRRRTGRNAQFNLKARPDTIKQFCDVADARGWGLGETLEHAVALLQREYGQ